MQPRRGAAHGRRRSFMTESPLSITLIERRDEIPLAAEDMERAGGAQ